VPDGHGGCPPLDDEAIPGATLTKYDGEGHMIAVTHRADVVRDLLAPSRPEDHRFGITS
jgi:hypothetical protein